MKLTDRAVQKITELRGERTSLRIELRPGGCCGTYYHSGVSEAQPVGVIIEQAGVQLFLQPEAYQRVKGCLLDYGPTLKPPRFRILRTSGHKCACGGSFGQPYPGKRTPVCQAYEPMPWDQQGVPNSGVSSHLLHS